jgi:hypothetical protein
MPAMFMVAVVTRDRLNPEEVTRAQINYNNSVSRTWLVAHTSWAIRHNKTVTIFAINAEDD